MQTYRLLFLLPCFVFSGCIIGAETNKITGTGPLETRTIDVADFSSIHMSIPGDLIVTQGNEESLSIAAQSNLYSFINIFVRDGRLRIETNDDVSLDPTEPITIEVGAQNLDRLAFAGAGTVSMDSLQTVNFELDLTGSADMQFGVFTAETLDLSLSGSGNLTFAGTVTEQNITIAGSGDVEARNLESQFAEVSISGSGMAIVNVSDELVASIAGSGNIRYLGNPSVDSSVTGSGSVEPLE